MLAADSVPPKPSRRRALAYGLPVVSRMFDPPRPVSSLRELARKGSLRTFQVGRCHMVRPADLAAFLGCTVDELP